MAIDAKVLRRLFDRAAATQRRTWLAPGVSTWSSQQRLVLAEIATAAMVETDADVDRSLALPQTPETSEVPADWCKRH